MYIHILQLGDDKKEGREGERDEGKERPQQNIRAQFSLLAMGSVVLQTVETLRVQHTPYSE